MLQGFGFKTVLFARLQRNASRIATNELIPELETWQTTVPADLLDHGSS